MPAPMKALISQHRHCDETWAGVEAAVRDSRWEEAARGYASFVTELLAHLDLEEHALFPAFEHATGITHGPTQVMRMEHDDMRDLLAQLKTAVAAKDARATLSAGETLLILIQQHNMKEENVLYPMCERSIPDLAEKLGLTDS